MAQSHSRHSSTFSTAAPRSGRSFVRTLRAIKKVLRSLSILMTDIIYYGSDKIDFFLQRLGDIIAEFVDGLAWPFKKLFVFSDAQILKFFDGRPLALAVPLLFVANILFLVYMVFMFCALPISGLGALSSWQGIVFNLLTLLTLIAYYKGVVTDPGGIPDTDDWKKFGGVEASKTFERKRTGQRRYCTKEEKYKPDRAHFCTPLCRNVLRMDHYCPWLVNCVGFHNHKYFFLFLLYVVLATNSATCYILHLLTSGVSLQPGQLFFLLEGLSLSGILSIIVTPFFLFHCWLVSNNMTTVEYCEKRRDHSTGEIRYTSPYDKGIIHNWQSVMGRNPFLWLIPTAPTGRSSGLFFPVNHYQRQRVAIQKYVSNEEDASIKFSSPKSEPKLDGEDVEDGIYKSVFSENKSAFNDKDEEFDETEQNCQPRSIINACSCFGDWTFKQVDEIQAFVDGLIQGFTSILDPQRDAKRKERKDLTEHINKSQSVWMQTPDECNAKIPDAAA